MKRLPAIVLACFTLAGALTLAISASEAKAAEPASGVVPAVVSCKFIRTAAQLQAIRNDLTATYCLANDIDLASIANFVPIGEDDTPFTGNFFGNNHVIRNLTISDTTGIKVGLFRQINGTIHDVSLVNADLRSAAAGATVGGLAGRIVGFIGVTDSNVSVSGKVNCINANICGGIAGELVGATLANSSSSVEVMGGFFAGGLLGLANGPISDSFATGDVTCGDHCTAGGLAGAAADNVEHSFATGAVTAGVSATAGGLVGLDEPGGLIGVGVNHSFATGPVSAGGSSLVGGLVGSLVESTLNQSFSVGPVHGGANSAIGGLAGSADNSTSVFASYWDTDTSGLKTSALGTGLTTARLWAALPPGFTTGVWAITKTLSYPFINDVNLAFNAPLATQVFASEISTSLPISQLDASQYRIQPAHADQAALATVYTMIARAVGSTENVAQLKNVKIDRYFWHDSMQATTFSGPVTKQVELGAPRPIGATASLNAVVDVLNTNRLVILRGTYTTPRGSAATHWMLATLYTKNGRSVGTIVANDPWTGRQVEIDPMSKKVVSPPDFPLKDFKVSGFQPANRVP